MYDFSLCKAPSQPIEIGGFSGLETLFWLCAAYVALCVVTAIWEWIAYRRDEHEE